MWPHPFKRLLFPFDRNPKRAEAQMPARVFQSAVLDHLNRGDAGIAIEAVRVGNQRPQLLRRRFKIEFPAVIEFFGHQGSALHQERNVYSTDQSALKTSLGATFIMSLRANDGNE